MMRRHTAAFAILASILFSAVGAWAQALSGFQARAHSTAAILTPGGTTSTASFVMLGLAGSITPTSSGNVAIWIAGDGTNNTLGDGCILRITMGTGTAPTNGQALTGTDWSPADLVVQANVATDVVPFPALGYATGLTIGTPYWYDIAFAALTGGTCTLSKIGATAFEQ